MEVLLQRVCGGCTACCKTHAVTVFKIEKPVGKWCPYCNISQGCRIYPNHPKECKDFRCEWLKGFGGDNHRPDRTRIVLDFFTAGIISQVLQVWEVSGGALRGEYAKQSIGFALSNGISVGLIHLSGRKEFMVGDIKLSKEAERLLAKNNIKIVPPLKWSV